jgi:hypothetical protein
MTKPSRKKTKQGARFVLETESLSPTLYLQIEAAFE